MTGLLSGRGDQPKSNYRVTSRESLIRAGSLGTPAIVPNHAEQGVLVRYVSGEVEDLEMPPLGKRQKYPALTPPEIARLRLWIDQGAPWPAQVALGK